MKKARTFKASWFFLAVLVAIVIGEVFVKQISDLAGIRLNGVTVAFLCTGLVAVVTSLLYDGADMG
jgi:hypothetical protein